MARQHHAARVSHESAFLFEVLHFSEARLERILLGADLTLFRFPRPDGGGGAVASVLYALEVRGGSDSLAHQPRHPFFLARDLRELRLEARNVFAPAAFAGAGLRHLALEIGSVLGEPRLFDARDDLSGANGLAFVGDRADQASAARK